MNISDDRGKIEDLLEGKDYSVTLVTFNKGAVRGNHYHEKTTQIDIILEGSLDYVRDDERGVIDKGGVLIHQPNQKHAYKAKEDSALVTLCFGARKGKDYETDVIRLTGKNILI